MKFEKWQGCGNDYIFVNGFEESVDEVLAECETICDRHFGVGSDGIIFCLPSNKADIRMRMFNNDASEGEMCGNGIRCFAKWVKSLGLVKKDKMTVETGAGIIIPEILPDGRVKVDMGLPHLSPEEIPVKKEEESVIHEHFESSCQHKDYDITCVSMGNPHCVIFVPHIEDIDPYRDGPEIETDEIFPKKTNVEFVEKKDDHHLRMRVWERGTGVTMACGTGTCATVVAATLNGLVDREADVILDGGTLHLLWDKDSGHVFMTGPAERSFYGEYKLKSEK